MNNVWIVLAGDNYYPQGPEDIQGVYATAEDAHRRAEALRTLPPRTSGFPRYDWVTVESWPVE